MIGKRTPQGNIVVNFLAPQSLGGAVQKVFWFRETIGAEDFAHFLRAHDFFGYEPRAYGCRYSVDGYKATWIHHIPSD